MKALQFIVRPFAFLFANNRNCITHECSRSYCVTPSTGSGFHLDMDTALFAIAFTLAVVIIALLGVAILHSLLY